MRARLSFLVVLLTFVGGCSVLGRLDLGRVVTSGRDGWQHPEQVIAALDLSPGDRVAEIGAGNGYWLPWLAEAVGSDGRVYAVEVDDVLVEELLERVARESLDNVVVVPQSAVQHAQQGLTAYVVDGNQKAQIRPVEIGEGNTDDVVITKGIAPGDRVVVAGQYRLQNGSTVAVNEASNETVGRSARP